MLTATTINAAIRAGKPCEINDPAEPGLNIRIGKKSATWIWMGRDSHGRVRRFRLGRYPHVGLAEARRRARAMADAVRCGADPVAEARQRRAAQEAPKGHTLFALLNLYRKQVGTDKKSWPVMEKAARYIFRAHLETPLSALSLGAMQMTIDEYPKPKAARFGLNCLRPVLNWAAAAGRCYIDRSLLDLASSAPKPERDRLLSREELAALLPVLRERSLDDVYAAAHRFILSTLARRDEVASARWRDVDFVARIWTIPVSKNKHPHLLPLSLQAMALLRGLGRPDPDPEALVFTTAGGRRLARSQDATRQLQAASGTSGWHRHDLRRRSATGMSKLAVEPHVIKAALNHVEILQQIDLIYIKNRYLPEVAAGLQKLADRLDGIEHGGAEIVALRTR